VPDGSRAFDTSRDAPKKLKASEVPDSVIVAFCGARLQILWKTSALH